jgi:hypothetical protein
MALLAAFVGGYGFDTMDRAGTMRVRSALFVWRWALARLPIPGSPALERMLFAGALATALAGFFVLIALASTVEDDQPSAPGPATAAVALVRTALGRVGWRSAPARACGVAMGALALFVAWRTGVFAATRILGVDDTFAAFDHPFHIARAETLIRSLLDGHMIRWVANHQGGYPAEFYPFGFAWFEAVLWGLTGGAASIALVHRFAVVLLFVAPGLLFAAMARRDGWPPLVALAAFVLHIAVPGDMWGGGYGELVYVGLVANISAGLFVVVSMAAAADAFASGSRRAVAVAAAAAAAAIWCNPRSVIGLVVCVGAAWTVASWQTSTARSNALKLLAIASLATLLAAPELVSLIRYRHLYFFIRYTSYANVLYYVISSIETVSVPGVLLAVVGLLVAMSVARERYVTRTTGAALVAYVVTTLVFSFGAVSLVEQLETTRLMPVQRLLTTYLAAVGLHAVACIAVERLRAPRWTGAVAQVAVIAAVLFIYVGTTRLMPFWSRGLFEVQRSGVPAMATFQQVLRIAGGEAPPGTAILVVGSAVSSHQQLWAPVRLDRLFFYDDWMWYWQTKHRGPYDPTRTSRYDPDRIDEIFERNYLDENAIGAVVVEQSAQLAADAAPALRRMFGGDYGLYLVDRAVPIVTFDGTPPTRLTVDNETIAADGLSRTGQALVRRNWFPRWRANVNGRPAPVIETDDGYMRVPVPPGPVHVVLTYAFERVDLAGRAAAIGGAVLLLALAVRRRRATA